MARGKPFRSVFRYVAIHTRRADEHHHDSADYLQVPRLRTARRPSGGTGRPPESCAGRGHTRVSAWRERRRLAAEQAGTTISPAEDGSPLTAAKMTGAELLRSLRAEAGRITALGAGLRERIDTLTDPTAAEACSATPNDACSLACQCCAAGSTSARPNGWRPAGCCGRR